MMGSIDRKLLYSKVKRYVIPLPFLLYFFNGLDRNNISFAALTMNLDLGISAVEFGTITSAFFITYLLFQIPSNMLLKKIGASKLIPTIVCGWGLVTAFMFTAQSANQVLICRIALGMFEAGFFAGMMYWFTLWFPTSERARVTSVFMLSMTISQIVGAPVAGCLLEFFNFGGIPGWRWLFLIEGLPVAVFALVGYFVIKDSPDKAKWLTIEEKAFIRNELEAEKALNEANSKKVNFRTIVANANLWKLAGIYCFINAAVTAASMWLPILIQGIDTSLSSASIGFIMMIPAIVSAFAMVVVGNHSDKTGERKWHLTLPIIGLMISFILINLPIGSMAFKLFALVLYGATIMSYMGPYWTLPPAFLSAEGLAVSVAIINSLNAIGAFSGNMLTGIVMTRFGTPAVFTLFAAFLVVAVLLVLTLDFKVVARLKEATETAAK